MGQMRHVCDAYINELLKKNPQPRILDVGAGNNPHPRAAVVLDLFPDEDRERTGKMVVPEGVELVEGDVCNMHMFADNEFDFVIASHILEHVVDPFKACSELSRVAKAGFVETPGKAFELLHGWYFHRWYVSLVDNKLVFERIYEHPKLWNKFLQPAKPFKKKLSRFLPPVVISHFFPLRFEKAAPCDLFGFFLKKVSHWLYERFWNAWEESQQELLYTTHLWEDRIEFEVYDRVRLPGMQHPYSCYDHHHVTWANPEMHYKQRRNARGNLEYLTSNYPHERYPKEAEDQ